MRGIEKLGEIVTNETKPKVVRKVANVSDVHRVLVCGKLDMTLGLIVFCVGCGLCVAVLYLFGACD